MDSENMEASRPCTEASPPVLTKNLRPNMKLLRRSNAIREASSPPPEMRMSPSPEPSAHVNNNSAGIGRPITKKSYVNDYIPNTFEKESPDEIENFIIEKINESLKDRQFLLKTESELVILLANNKKHTITLGSMGSYQRMLVHKVAEYFLFDHHVDTTGQSVVVTKTQNTRLPDKRFKQFIMNDLCEPRRSILKRDSASFESTEGQETDGQDSQEDTKEWVSGVSRMWAPHVSEDFLNVQPKYNRFRRLKKGESYESKDTLKANSLRSSIGKSNSFGGYDQNANARVLTKQDSGLSMGSGVSPLSSGYKSQSLRSDTMSATPSPSGTPHLTVPVPNHGGASLEEDQTAVLWAVSKMCSIPVGSILINPETGTPYKNEDGTTYHYDPSNPPNLKTECFSSHSTPEHLIQNTRSNDYECLETEIQPTQSLHQVNTEEHNPNGENVRNYEEECGNIMNININQLECPEPLPRRTSYASNNNYNFAQMPMTQPVIHPPPLPPATILPRGNDWPTIYRPVYNTGRVPVPVFGTAQLPPPPIQLQYQPHTLSFGFVPNHLQTNSQGAGSTTFTHAPGHPVYAFPPYFSSVAVGIPPNRMYGGARYLQVPAPSHQVFHNHMPQTPQMCTNCPVPAPGFHPYQAGTLPAPPLLPPGIQMSWT